MRFFILVFGLSVVVGCKDDAKEFEGLADRACACADGDAACGNKVLADVVKFAGDHGTSHSDQRRINKAGVRLTECLTSTGVQPTELTSALERM